MEDCIKTGAYVHLVDYGTYAAADIFGVDDTRVVRFNGDLAVFAEFNPGARVTHEMYLNRSPNYFRKDLGIAVVNVSDLKDVQVWNQL